MILYLIIFLFQKSFRPKFLSVAELLCEEGFEVGGFSYLKCGGFITHKAREFSKFEMYSACHRSRRILEFIWRQKKRKFSKYNRDFWLSDLPSH